MYTSYQLYYQNYKFATTYPISTNVYIDKYLVLVYLVDSTIHILSVVDIYNSEVFFLYNYASYTTHSHAYSTMILMKIFSYHQSISYFDIDVIAFNYLAISLYSWLGYSVLIQRIIISQSYILVLKNTKVHAKNFWRRCLLLKYL